MSLREDRRIVLTLDAGGTSFRFNAVRGGRALLDPVRLPSCGDDLRACLDGIVKGFEAVHEASGREAVAISFAFPGPADYASGIIGDLPNLTAFRGGIALGPMLEARFGLPTFIANDGALFAYGEALGGLLPFVNGHLDDAGAKLRFRNLLGFTLGTGFGCGLVVDGRLVRGDNTVAGQIWKFRHPDEGRCFVEEGVSIRALRRVYAESARIPMEQAPEPRVLAAIATGEAPGNAAAAREAFRRFGRVAGDAIAQALTLLDGLVVLGGGISAASALFLPTLIEELNGQLQWFDGTPVDRLEVRVVTLDDPRGLDALAHPKLNQVAVPGAGRTISYQLEKRTGIGLTRLGTSEAIALGAYAYALDRLS